MTAKSMFFMLGACVGVAAVLSAKAVRPLGAYAIAGAMIAYEAACEAAENSKDALSSSRKKRRRDAKGGSRR